MSIYIEGMKMPKNIGVSVTIYPDGKVIRYLGYGAKEQLGTAVPVPPHGRLGDLDELARKIEHDRYNHTHTDGMAARHHITEYGHFLKEIANISTIIPADPAEEGEL